jgi:hypothetical protein
MARLYLQGWPQWKIREKFGLSHQQISHDLKAIRAGWKASAVRDVDEAKSQELAKLNKLGREYRNAWEQSRDPRFLESIKRVISMRRRLL